MKNSFSFFNNKDCQYFPCHDVKNPDNFNCKFCYCPLYLLDCGGNFKINKEVKDCSDCMIPHSPKADDYINRILKEKVFTKKD